MIFGEQLKEICMEMLQKPIEMMSWQMHTVIKAEGGPMERSMIVFLFFFMPGSVL